MQTVLDPPPRPLLSVVGSAAFPVRRVWCVGRNYADHVREMGGDPDREPPFFFAKPPDAAFDPGNVPVPYPPLTSDLHHEVELVVALAAGGQNQAPEAALALVGWAGVGCDLTRRDLQAEAKRRSWPWEMSKGFDHSGPVGPLTPVVPGLDLTRGGITLSVNGDRRQAGDLAQMIWPVGELLAQLSRFVALAPGDVIFTGTPAGVGPLVPGDRVEAEVAGLAPLRFAVAATEM